MDKKTAKKYSKKMKKMKKEIHKAVIGQEDAIDKVIKCFFANGHALLEGVPGIAKTFLIRCLNQTIKESEFNRVQFTPDLLPADIIGLNVYSQKKEEFYVRKGPIFTNFLLADEINRAPPKVQSALLEAMQERFATIGKKDFSLPNPFLVLATQNPLEQMGTYPLPEAQIDRFLFKINVYYPKKDNELKIIDTNMDSHDIDDFGIEKVFDTKQVLKIQTDVQEVYLSEKVKQYIVNLVEATRKPEKYDLKYKKYIDWGGSPRASINLAKAAKVDALFSGENFVTPDNVKSIAPEVLRHRILLNYEGKAMQLKTDDIVKELLDTVPVP